MPKILLVEDDQNLSEIYEARLSAEGYEIVSAANGEDALAVAAKEKPDLVISDVMMPRVSGFEMLDILRHTDGMQGVKVIMLTALGQDNDRSKASELGADRYLVKSQVTLEDIVDTAKELLGEDANSEVVASTQEPTATTTADQTTSPNTVETTPQNVIPEPVNAPQTPSFVTQPPLTTSSTPPQDPPASVPPVLQRPVDQPVAQVNEPTQTVQAPLPTQSQTPVTPSVSLPITDPATPPSSIVVTSEETAEERANQFASPIAVEEAEMAESISEDMVSETPKNTTDNAPQTLSVNNGSQITAQPNELPVTPSAPSFKAVNEPSNIVNQVASSVASSPESNESPSTISSQIASTEKLPQNESLTSSIQPPSPVPGSTATSTTNEVITESSHDAVLAAALKELDGEESSPATSVIPSASSPEQPGPTSDPGNSQQISGHKIIVPPSEPANKPDINTLLSKEAEHDNSSSQNSNDTLNSTL